MKIKFLFCIYFLTIFFCRSLLFAQLIQFQKTYGGSNNEMAESVVQTDDGGYLMSGWTTSFGTGGDIYLVKTNSVGDTLWTKSYGGLQADYGKAIQTSDGGYALGAATYSFGPGTPAYQNFLLIKINSLGDTLWSKSYGGIADDYFGSFRQTT